MGPRSFPNRSPYQQSLQSIHSRAELCAKSRSCRPYKPEEGQHVRLHRYSRNSIHPHLSYHFRPREAAMLTVRLINHRNPHISMLALALLDTLVQACGYPFHLQISTKEFLNELVRRFPERPPPFPGPVMTRILELIHTWKESICTESKWKEDLGNIRDMHRLLTFKGYRFREIHRTDTPSATVSLWDCFLSFQAELVCPDEIP